MAMCLSRTANPTSRTAGCVSGTATFVAAGSAGLPPAAQLLYVWADQNTAMSELELEYRVSDEGAPGRTLFRPHRVGRMLGPE
jgi:hypothetical protein